MPYYRPYNRFIEERFLKKWYIVKVLSKYISNFHEQSHQQIKKKCAKIREKKKMDYELNVVKDVHL